MDENRLPEQMREKAGTALSETAQKVSEAGQEWSEKAKGAVRDTGAATDLYLHEYAWTSVALIAALAGILGFFLGAQRR